MMTANQENISTIIEATAVPAFADITANLSAVENELSSEDAKFAASLAQRAAHDAEYAQEFTAAPHVPGEFLVKINDLRPWEYHLRRFSPDHAAHASALALSAADPLSFRPITVIEKDGFYEVVNGRFIFNAIKAYHPDSDTLEIRVVLFQGTEQDAVAAMCDAALGTVAATKMEQAHGLLSLQRSNRISQAAVAARYAGLTEDKVSQMLTSARLHECHPVLFGLLEQPHLAPISYGNTLAKTIKAMTKQALKDALDHLHALEDAGHRCKRHEILDLFAAGKTNGAVGAGRAPVKTRPIIPIESDTLHGHDDQPIGAYELLVDGYRRLRLPHIDSDTPLIEREAALDACMRTLRQHFRLDHQG